VTGPRDDAVRIGVDVLDRGELRRLLERPWFLDYTYAAEERALAEAMAADRRLEFLAGRFAAKEAVLKVLGKGMFQGIALSEIAIVRAAGGSPEVRFLGRAAGLGLPAVALSITHKRDVVAAVAIAVSPRTSSGRTPGEPEKGEPRHVPVGRR
jgi:holo-[acyl-carrier protein] synthase